MPTDQAQTKRQSLHLYIDPSPYKPQARVSPESNSSSSAYASVGTAGTTPTSGFDTTICSVLCMYDFNSDDPDHLSFSKNEILEIVRQEDTGWWAAMRKNKDEVGWIPQAFVNPLSNEMTERLRNTREELRVYEYDAEQLYNSAPIQRFHQLYESVELTPSPSPTQRSPDPQDTRMLSPGPPYSKNNHTQEQDEQIGVDSDPSYRLIYQYIQQRPFPPPSPSTPMPRPPPAQTAPVYNKPCFLGEGVQCTQTRCRAGSAPTQVQSPPLLPILDDRPTLSSLTTVMEPYGTRGVLNITTPGTTGSLDILVKRSRSQRMKKAMVLDESRATQPTVQSLAKLPWYLRPAYPDQLELDSEGHVRWGTLTALVERLTFDTLTRGDPIRIAGDIAFRSIFLMTFRTFTSADEFFDMLVDRYHMIEPDNLTAPEFDEWKDKRLLVTQRNVLTVFTVWLEDHRLLEEEPHVAQRLTDFLNLITTPPPLALTAQLIIKSIERLTFASPSDMSPVISPSRKARKSRAHTNNLLKLDPVDIAEQFSLLEFKLYAKVTPQECIKFAKFGSSKCKGSLGAFCSTHDKLAAWVKTSILNNEALSKRADTVDFWIKVAEKCRNMNNIASMSAVINALSSTVITRLHLTWAHVGRRSNLDALLRHNEPMGGFSGYRNLLHNVEGPCVPFVGMYMTDIVHIQDQFSDEDGRICFLQRQRWYEAVSAMLRYQTRPYDIVESESTMNFIQTHLRDGMTKDQSWFWSRSQEVQQTELAHADIRKGLEAAGF